ncbi:MAG: GreA/GreB family elongation factor [Armatimonadota bacterium]
MSELSDRLRDMLATQTGDFTLSSEDRSNIAQLFAEAGQDEQLVLAALVQRVLQEHPGHLQAQYARATAEELVGEHESAGNQYLQLAQALVSQKDWVGVLDLALHAMPLTGDYRLVRLVRRAGEKGEIDITAALECAREECTDSPDLLLEASQEADARGEKEEGTKLAIESLERYVEIKEPEKAEDPLLRVLEAQDHITMERLLSVLRRMATAGQVDLLTTAFELAEDKLFDLGMAEELAVTLADILERKPELRQFRPLYARAATRQQGDNETTRALIKETGLDNPDVPIEDALAAFREVAAYSPGAYVSHRSWGVGTITRNDNDELTIDFEQKPHHKMALAMAKQVLLPLPKDSLQVQRYLDLDGLKRQAEAQPGEIVFRLLMESGGEIVTPDIKMRLTSWLIPEEKWATWWKKARKAVEEDPRIDTSQAFRHLYREAQRGGEADVPMLSLDPRKGIKGAMSLIHKLLAQHPQMNDRAKMAYGTILRKMLDATSKSDDKVRALPLLAKWYPEREAEWLKEAEEALQKTSLTFAGEQEDQQILLELGLKTRAWKDAAFAALASRFDPVRERGLEVLGERAGEGLWDDFEDLLLSSGHFQEKMAVAEMIIQGQLTRDDVTDELPLSPWVLFYAALSVAGSKAAHAGRGASNRFLRVSGPLTAWLKKAELTEEFNSLLDHFRRRPIEGEIQLQIQALLEEVGQPQLSMQILRMNIVLPEDEQKPPELDPRITLMTRATLRANVDRLREMEHMLAVEIPDEIAKARALGDLSENAEYHAARERQGITKALHDNLQASMETAFAIEDIHRAEGIAGVGKIIKLHNRVTGEDSQVWLLGEGDSQSGDSVISYKAPLGQSLVGKHVGDVIELPGQEGEEVEIVSIEEKLP